MQSQDFDVLIIGAGISGIGAACHLSRECPNRRVAIIERRKAMGGTWDLFRYPGIRSDSDMFTFGYNFRPWTNPKTLADGPSIKRYVMDAARESGVDKKIHYGLSVTGAFWNSKDQQWTIETLREENGEVQSYTCSFLLICTGYYNYDKGYKPDFPGEKDFEGRVIHPQQWPEDLDYSGKRVVVIGSGATAVTLIPAMADKTSHITMLQRSPTYMMSLPEVDPIASRLMGLLPEMATYRIMRARNIALQYWSFVISRKYPKQARELFLALARWQLGKDIDMRHFTPSYNPWDERICAMPGGDLFKAIRSGRASIVTDKIKTFIPNGILLESGKELEADIIVSATGLDLQFLGGMKLTVDGKVRLPREAMLYKSVLLEGIPNASIVIGYTNASWTLRADLAAEYLCRLLNHMDKKGYAVVTPVDREGCRTEESVMGSLKSGYVYRAIDKMPRQGRHGPWKLTHNYYRDILMLRKGVIEDQYLEFSRAKSPMSRSLTLHEMVDRVTKAAG
ncbi:MAG: NAD(P)/FAD-dependent oxidoreductase [Deltaproteobacteria bacterium]|nr:NAD(P)/FAD-dependent oxidoreductase [Deltaproteobacteria bacterium]